MAEATRSSPKSDLIGRFDPDKDPALRDLCRKALDTAKSKALVTDSKGERVDPETERAWQFFLLYNSEVGVFGSRKGNRYRISRRQWIEMLVRIDDKRSRAVDMELNQSQRNEEGIILRMERAGVPVRIVILKVRQNGISTFHLAFILWLILTHTNIKARIITDREELCETLLNRLKRMFDRLHRRDGEIWALPKDKSNRDMIVLGEPFNSSIHVVSANTPNPGFGETNICVDMEETSKWPDAAEKGKGVELALPEVPGSFAFDVSQPKGNTGYFARKFKRAWYRQLGLANPDGEEVDESLMAGAGWKPMFIPWFLHEEYRWTRIGSNPPTLPDGVRAAIEKTLDAEEKVLLQQTYYLRRKGRCNVDYDQLAWRRYYIAEKCNGNVQTFHEQCPAFPEEAFLASGRPAFNIAHIQRVMASKKRPPLLVGRVLGNGKLDENKLGELWLWSLPEKGRQYAIGVDTSAGVKGSTSDDSRGGDPCAACVVDMETDALVAEWYGWEAPYLFGPTVARLSAYFNAVTAIETHPSQHGLAVYDAAEQAGCKKLYVQSRWDDREGKFQMLKGWRMSASAKNKVLNRVSEVLAEEDCDIPSARLLQELLDAQIDDQEKIARTCRNDLMMAYGIALALSDHARVEKRAAPEPEKLPPTGSDEAFWRERKLRLGMIDGRTGRRTYDKMNGAGL